MLKIGRTGYVFILCDFSLLEIYFMLDLPSKCFKVIFSLTFLFFLLYTVPAQTGKNDVVEITVSASFYCHGSPQCKIKGKGLTATGERVRDGIIAVDPKVIPLRRTIEIVKPESLAGMYRSSDTGGKRIKGKFIDIWVPTQKRAMRLGIVKNIVLKVYPKDYKSEVNKEKATDVSKTVE